MKSLILKLIPLFAIFAFSGEGLAVTPPRGLVVFTEPPADYAMAVEFSALETKNVAYATATLADGKKQEIPRGGILAVIDYPGSQLGGSIEKEAAIATQKIQTLRAKYPQLSAKLDKVSTAWANAVTLNHQQRDLPSASQSAPRPAGLALEIDGVSYTGVLLTSFDGSSVGIEHSGGVARIPAAKLKVEQINALNATTPSVRIDPAKIVQASSDKRIAPSDGTAPTTAPQVVAPRENVAEIQRLKAVVAAAQAAVQKLTSEETSLRDRIHAPSNGAKSSAEIIQMNNRLAAVNDDRQQAQLQYERTVRELEAAELAAFAKIQAATVDAYKAAAILPADPPNWEDVAKKWTDEAEAQSKTAEAARSASLKVFSKDGNTFESLRLGEIRKAEEAKLDIAKQTASQAKQQAAAAKAEKERIAKTESDRMQTQGQAARKADELQKFKELPINNEKFVTPPGVSQASPSYEETIEFLATNYGVKIGFGETSKKLICRYTQPWGPVAYVFDPRDVTPEIIMQTDVNGFGRRTVRLFLKCRNSQRRIEGFMMRSQSTTVSRIEFYAGDEIDAEKIAKALSHLVTILGATKEAF
jgi:hypothetical protein